MGCEKCEDGFRREFTVFERKNSRRVIEKIRPETPREARETEQKLEDKYTRVQSPNYERDSKENFSSTVYPCSCRLGQYQQAAMSKAGA